MRQYNIQILTGTNYKSHINITLCVGVVCVYGFVFLFLFLKFN